MQKKIGIFSDTHGNYPAMRAVVDYFRSIGCDEIVHTGDAVTMGPYSPECLEFLFNSDITLICGNHDINYINDDDVVASLSHVPSEHKRFVFDQLGDKYRDKMRFLPLVVNREYNGLKVTFLHYGLSKSNIYKHFAFEPINPTPDAQFFDSLFDGVWGDVVIFGHKHEPIDLVGQSRYIDVGSVGCHEQPFAKGIVLTVNEDASYDIERVNVAYDRASVYERMKQIGMPYADQIWNFYFKESLNKR